MVTPCLCVTMFSDERFLVTLQGDQATLVISTRRGVRGFRGRA
jgi:hypothetical protein